MAKAADFNGDANETDVIPPEKCRGKGRPSILSEKAYLWLLTINNPQDHGISLDQKDILERLKDDIAAGKIVYMIARMFLLSLSFSYPRFRFSQSQLTLSHRDKGLRVVPRFAEKTGMADSQGERGIPQPNL